MVKHATKVIAALSLVICVLFSSTSISKASFDENPNGVYLELARQVYNVKANNIKSNQDEIEAKLNSRLAGGVKKFDVIDTIDVNSNPYHPAGVNPAGYNNAFDATGFKAMAVVISGSKKVFIVFCGSKDVWDIASAERILANRVPGQLYQAQIYTNYIYEKYSQYKDYDWYFTGHSLGGWLAAKVYLDIRAGNWVTPSTTKYKYGGPIGKSNISGVFTFNPLPIGEQHVSSTQWNANNNGVYDAYIKNLYIQNEWLNTIQDMHPDKLQYFGTKGSINTGIKYYSDWGLKPASTPYLDVAGVYYESAFYQKAVNEGHRICQFGKWVTPIGNTCEQ
ncbi:lipase family protein [Bacillus infantis]|uniref:lipase family protein n=1 Tax=Bacillus infantis TaxID=324767 RepID=UPI003CFB9E58